jgi:Ca2+/Na+ antiporter
MPDMTKRTGQRSLMNRILGEYRGQLFIIGMALWAGLVGLGLSFLIAGVQMGTQPPSPYFESFQHRVVFLTVATSTMLLGYLLVRRASRLAGWGMGR